MNELKEISEKLDLLIKLSFAKFLEDKDFNEQVRTLNQVGVPPKTIAELTGKTANNVSVTLNKIKKKNKN
jgi:hypothetical protein